MLYIIATPIGNLNDITLRALKILREVEYIFAEDTRNIKKLLAHFKIKNKKIESYHKYNEKRRVSYIVELIDKEKKVALVSDAGTPLISDPGLEIVKECFKRNIKLIPVPGVSALTTLLSVSPFKNNEFIFVGFLEKKFDRKKKQLNSLISSGKNIYFFESPNRILETLKIIEQIDPEIKIILGRELTKLYEEILFQPVKNLVKYFTENTPKGEFTVGIFNEMVEEKDKETYIEDVKLMKSLNFTARDIARFISKKYNIAKSKIYEMVKDE